MPTKFYPENLNARDHMGHLDLDRRIILKQTLKIYGVKMWTGFIRIGIGSSGRLL
jgi:hypothetical protein